MALKRPRITPYMAEGRKLEICMMKLVTNNVMICKVLDKRMLVMKYGKEWCWEVAVNVLSDHNNSISHYFCV
jgi:hypothetical protein